jgi:hypothetical protein
MTKSEKRDYDRRRYQANRDRIKERSRQYHHANRERELARMQDYYYLNRDERLDAGRSYRQKKKLGDALQETNQPDLTGKFFTIIDRIDDILLGGVRM